MRPIVTVGIAWSVRQSVLRSVTTVNAAKMLNRSRCSLGCGLGWVQGMHIGATWQIRFNRACAVTMRFFCQITLTTGHHCYYYYNFYYYYYRPHRSTTYVDAAYCYRPSSVVCWSVGRSVCHTSEPCKNGWIDRDTEWVEDSSGPKEPCIRWGPDPNGKGQLWGKKGRPL